MPKEKPENTIGRPIVPFRKVMYGIMYIIRTGCHWKMLSSEYGSGFTCHRRYPEWVGLGIFEKLWIKVLNECDDKSVTTTQSERIKRLKELLDD